MTGLPVKVSVIVPIYNVEDCLASCLNSCMKQTLRDVEFVCVNDGSTDGSLEILEKYAKLDNRIKIVNKVNGGLSSARNAGMDNANGEIIMFLDSDDLLSEHACERVWNEFFDFNPDIVIYSTSVFPDYPEPDKWYGNVLSVNYKHYTKFTPKVLFDEPGAKPFVWRQAFSKELLNKSKVRFDETVKYGEDTVFQMEIFPHANKFSFIPDYLYNYRWYRKGSLMQTLREDMDSRIEEHIKLADIIAQYWQKQGWLNRYKKQFAQWLYEFLIIDIRNYKTKNKKEHLESFSKLVNKYGLNKYLNQFGLGLRSVSTFIKFKL